MPTYGYRCPSCSLEFEVWQRMSDEPVAECPNCGTVARRLFFPAGIVFKGTGFYKTDNRASGGDGAKPSSSESAKKPDKASKPASDSSGTSSASTSTSGS